VSEKRLAAAVDALLDELVGSGAEVGLQVAVIRNGRTVVDAAVASDGSTPVRPEPGSPLDRAMPPGVFPGADYANRPDLLTSGPSRPNGRGRPGSTFGMWGMNGSAAYADIDSGVAVAVMRNRFAPGDISTISRIDQLIADELP
jgi:CubicO group peptidase (beta-lactamase class C family)